MKYCKPEVAVLGDAVHVIQQMVKFNGTIYDGEGHPRLNAAYDLDD